MRRHLLRSLSGIAFIIILLNPGLSFATYSIVAVDTVTGDVGGAGASCISGAQIINDLIEGVGGIHTQAYYLSENQDNAHDLLAAGWEPDSILDWLFSNDATSAPLLRQYGIVTLAGPGTSASFTGNNTDDWKGHITGPGYAIQGNILLGPEILENIEAAFLATSGPLEDKLMAALEAANVPGADTRCLGCNKSAISAFIKVVRIGDGDTPYLYEVVDNTACSDNPTLLLRAKYDLWKALQYADAEASSVEAIPDYLPANGLNSAVISILPLNYDGLSPVNGVEDVVLSNSGFGLLSAVADDGDGSWLATITAPAVSGVDTLTVTVTAGGEVVVLNQKPTLLYYLCGDANSDQTLNVGDAVYVINYVFKSGPPPEPLDSGDANCDGAVNVGDAVYLINYVFKSGDEPCCLTD